MGNVPEELIVTTGTALKEKQLPELEEEGWVFKGWFIEEQKIETGYEVKGDVTFTAKWAKLYKVTYFAMGITVPEPVFVEDGTVLTEKELPEIDIKKDGYIFRGWFTSDTFEKVTPESNYIVTADLTLELGICEACKITYKIFDVDYDSYIEDISETGLEGKSVAEGYCLKAEDLPESLGEDFNQVDWGEFEAGYEIFSSVEITAYVTRKTYTIKYSDEIGGRDGYSDTIYSGEKLSDYYIPELEVTGYRFNGWFENGKKVEKDTVVREDRNFTASWTKLMAIKYYNGSSSYPYKTKYVESGYVLTADDVTADPKTGYRFDGCDKNAGLVVTEDIEIRETWVKLVKISYSSKYAECPEKKWVDSGYALTAEDLPAMKYGVYRFDGWDKTTGDVITADTVIRASWTEFYYIEYSSTYGTAPASKLVEKNYELTAEDLPDLGDDNDYRFTGWSKDEGYVVTGTTYIHASWELIKWTVSFESAYGTAPSSKTINSGYKLSYLTLPSMADAKIDEDTVYIFDDWYLGETKADDDYIVRSNITLTAKWIKAVRISYETEYSYGPNEKFVKPGYVLGYYDLPKLSYTSRYRFDGWNKNKGDVITEDTLITASWTVLKNISYESEYGTAPNTKYVEDGYKLTAEDLPVLESDGYRFDGWDKEAGFVVTEDVEITASWTKVYTISYVSEYGTAPASKTVESGYELTEQDLPVLDPSGSYRHFGWGTTAGTKVTANLTLTAVWKEFIDPRENYTFTESLTYASDLKTEIVGSGNYYYFGDWPQSAKAASVEIDKTISMVMGGNTYYGGSDGFWYAEFNSSYYKVEKILWKRYTSSYDQNHNCSLYVAASVLTAMEFCNFDKDYINAHSSSPEVYNGLKVYFSNYRYSKLRAYLNGDKSNFYLGTEYDYTGKGFLQSAFTATAQSKINQTYVSNDKDSARDTEKNVVAVPEDDMLCDTTLDYIFPLSLEDVTNTDLGFVQKKNPNNGKYTLYGSSQDGLGQKFTAYATAVSTKNDSDKPARFWWLRSPHPNVKRQVDVVYVNGKTGDSYCDAYTTNVGVVPAFTMK